MTHDPDNATFFRGSELPRLLFLLAILVGGMVLLWQYLYYKGNQPEPEPVATVPLPPIEPDRAPEFETVKDKTAIGLRDMAAYRMLLERARETPPAELARKSRRDVLSYQIWERPEHYRGVPIHLLGTVLRVLTYETKLSPRGRLYEAWMVTSDSQRNPYVCVFEDAPKGFPIGDQLNERVVFNGSFLKLMRYQGGDSLRVSPLLVGRIGWVPAAAPGGAASRKPFLWMAVAVAIMFVITFFRWMTSLRRALSPRSRPQLRYEHPSDQISADELADWVASQPDEDDDEGEGINPNDPARR
jgi:hypothetical protein